MGLHFGKDEVQGFEGLVERFSLLAFASPFRSTIPLLDFWREPELRLEAFARTVGIERLDSADLFFEFPVGVRRGRGKPSYTDLLIEGEDAAIAVEAKFTEPPYQDVQTWLGKNPTSNRENVLDGWLELVREATGCGIKRADVSHLPYQLIHRTASVCSCVRRRRMVVYHVFGDAPTNHYSEALSSLWKLLGRGSSLAFELLTCDLKPFAQWIAFRSRWESGERGLAEETRDALLRGCLFSFETLTREDSTPWPQLRTAPKIY